MKAFSSSGLIIFSPVGVSSQSSPRILSRWPAQLFSLFEQDFSEEFISAPDRGGAFLRTDTASSWLTLPILMCVPALMNGAGIRECLTSASSIIRHSPPLKKELFGYNICIESAVYIGVYCG